MVRVCQAPPPTHTSCPAPPLPNCTLQITSMATYSNFKGFSFILAVGQHPYAEGEQAAGGSHPRLQT